jgi:WD40 repeat protein
VRDCPNLSFLLRKSIEWNKADTYFAHLTVLVNKFRMMSGGILFAEDDEDDEDNGDVDDDDEYETMGISAADEELRIQAHDGIVTGIARIDRHAFVTSCINGQIKSWGLSDGSVRWSIQAQWQVRCLAAADGYVVAGFSDGSVVVYEAEEGQEILSFKAHNGGVTCIDFPNKAWLVTGGSDGEVKYWDLEEGGEPQQGTFHVDGRDIQHRFEGHDAPVVALQVRVPA